MRYCLLFLVTCSAMLVGCGNTLTDYVNNNDNPQDQQRYSMKGDGVEECLSADHAVYSVAHMSTGPKWDFFFHGQVYSLSAAQLTQPSASDLPAYISQDQVTLRKCNGSQLVVRQSARRVTLRNAQHQIVFDGQLSCMGYPPNGLALLPDENNLCP